MKISFFLSLLLLYYIYDGYLRLLLILAKRSKTLHPDEILNEAHLPTITILLTVFNEEKAIIGRLENILSCRYPPERLEILVASDGSTDSTDVLVKRFAKHGVRLFRPRERKGKTDTQNQAILTASGEILIFTDAETTFEPEFLIQIVKPFADPTVGGVGGNCLMRKESATGITESQNFYWRYELKLRSLESELGMLAVSSGACMAIRRNLFKEMEATYGEDCIIPLDVVLQGYRFVHAQDAVAYDTWASETGAEFKSRVRMTLRNWQGTWSRSCLLNPFRFGKISLTLWSHKVLRWLSPIFLISMTISAVALASQGSEEFVLVGLSLLVFYFAGLIGWWSEARGIRLPILSTVYSFLLANAGFLVGLWRSLRGHKVQAYRN